MIKRSVSASLVVLMILSLPYNATAGTLQFDGVPVDITTTDGEDLIMVPGTGGNIQIGDGSGSNLYATTNDDLHITGVLEANGGIYADGGILSGSDILPGTTDASSLGSATKIWKDLYVGNIPKIKNVDYSFPAAQGGANTYLRNDGAGNLTWAAIGGGGGALSALTAATAANTIDNAAYAQTWRWNLAATGNTGMTLDESAAATAGSTLLKLGTAAASTSGAMVIDNFGDGDALVINDQAADTTPFLVDEAGNVAIGTTQSDAALTIRGSGGRLAQWYMDDGTQAAYINLVGTIYTRSGVANDATANNAYVTTATTGTTISRNVADANPALIVQQSNAGSTGDILRVRNNTAGAPMTVLQDGSVLVGTPTMLNGGSKTMQVYRAADGQGLEVRAEAPSGTSIAVNGTAFGTASDNIGLYGWAEYATNNNWGLYVGNGDARFTGSMIEVSERGSAPSVSAADGGRIYFDATDNKFKISENGGAYVDLLSATSSSKLNAITDADGANTTANADFAQNWNWFLTTADKDAFTFGETTASTATGVAAILKASTLATSTATPLVVTNLGDGPSFRVNDETGDADTSPFIIAANGNVGIGTTTLDHQVIVEGTATSGTGSIMVSRVGNQPNVIFRNEGTLVGQLRGYSTPTTHLSLTNPNGSTQYFTVDTAGGNVGVGTSDPQQKLAVEGTLGLLESGSSPQYHTIIRSGDISTNADILYTLPGAQATQAGQVLTNDASGNLSWATVATGSATLDAVSAATAPATIGSGNSNIVWNWAISTASRSAFTFGESAASTNGVGAQSILKATTLGSSTAMPLWVVNEGDALSLRIDDVASDTSPFVVAANGNVGIGSAVPAAALDVVGNAVAQNIYVNGGAAYGAENRLIVHAAASEDAFILVKETGNDDEVGLAMDVGGGNLAKVKMNAGGSVLIDAADSAPILLNSSNPGNIGVGATAPAGLMHLYSASNASRGLLIDAQGSAAAQQGSVEFVTLGDGSKALGDAATKGWQWFGRGDAWSTADQQNDFGLSYWDGLAWRDTFRINSTNGYLGVGNGITNPSSQLELAGALTVKEMAAPANAPTDQGRIYFDSTANKFRVSENGGAYVDLVDPTLYDTLQNAYTNDADGADATILLSAADDSLVFRNPASSGTDSAFLTTFEQLNTGAKDGVIITQAGTGYALRVNDDGTAGDTTPFIVDAAGNVGIGTASPVKALQVNGAIALDDGSYLREYSGNISFFTGSDAAKPIQVGGVAITDNYSNDAPILGLYVKGNVGIGSLSPSSSLDVRNAVTAAAGSANGAQFVQTLTAAANDDAMTAVRIAPTFTNGAFTGVANYGLVVESGNVGIGTSAPQGVLDVRSNSTRFFRVYDSTTDAAKLRWDDDVTVSLTIANQMADPAALASLRFAYYDGSTAGDTSGMILINKDQSWTSTATTRDSSMSFFTTLDSTDIERLRIGSDGNVGIGDTSPDGRLDVEGGDVLIGAGTFNNASVNEDAYVRGNLEVDGVLYGNASGLTNIPGGALSALSNAAVDHTLTNGDNAQEWNWELTTADKDAFTFGETAASTATGISAILKAATVASSTATPLIVTNLGEGHSLRINDELGDNDFSPFAVTANGNVGIGTSAPERKLQLHGEMVVIDSSAPRLRVSTAVPSNGAAKEIFLEMLTGGTSYARLFATDNGSSLPMDLALQDPGGNVGIGVVDPQYKLEIKSDGTSDAALAFSDVDVAHGLTTVAQNDTFFVVTPISSTAGGVRVTALSDADAAPFQVRSVIGSDDPTDTIPAIKLIGAKSDAGIGAADLGSDETLLQIANNDNTSAVTVLGNGNVGIGSITPAEKLDVAGPMKIAQASAPGTTTDKLYNVGGALYWNGTNVSSPSITTRWDQLANPTGALALTMGGHTSTFTYGNATAGANLFNLTDGSSNSGTGYLMNLTTAAGSTLKPFHVSAAGTEALMVSASGNVGIGTTVPGNLLSVQATGANQGIYLYDSTGNRVFRADTAGGSHGRLGLKDSGSADLISLNALAGVDSYFNAGNVGIGTTAPSGAFDVRAGQTAASGTARGAQFVQTLTATANNDALTALRIAPTFTDGGFTGVLHNGIIVESGHIGIGTTTVSSAINTQSTVLAIHTDNVGGAAEINLHSNAQNSYIVSNSPVSFRVVSDALTIDQGYVRIDGVTGLLETTAPTATANYGKVYVKSSDSKLYFMNDSGTEFDLTASSLTPTLQSVYGNDVDGSDVTVALTSADDSLIFQNPASSGSDSTYLAAFDQLATGAVDNLILTHAGTGYALRVNDDGTAADTSPTVIDQNGNIGVGTTNPSDKIYIYQNADSTVSARIANASDSANASSIMNMQSATSTTSVGSAPANYTLIPVLADRSFLYAQSTSAGLDLLATAAAGDIRMYTGGQAVTNERMRVSADGQVVVGSGEAGATPVGNILRGPNGGGTDIAGGDLTIAAGAGTGAGTGGALLLKTTSAGSSGASVNSLVTRMAITNAGNVGIGTDSPSSRAHVWRTSVGGNSVMEAFRVSHVDLDGAASNGLGVSMSFTGESNSDTVYPEMGRIAAVMADVTDASKDASLQFYTLGPDEGAGSNTATVKMTILGNGNVGIGTTNPGAQLDLYNGSGPHLQLNANTSWTSVNSTANLFMQINGTTALSISPLNVGLPDGALFDMSSANMSVTSEGLKLPQTTNCATNTTVEGNICWDTDDNTLWIGDGTTSTQIGAGSSSTLQQAYGNDVDGSDVTVALTSADDSLIFQNPASSGSDSTYLAAFDQLATGAVDNLILTHAGTGYALRVNDDGTATDSTPFIINQEGNVAIGETSAGNLFSVNKNQNASTVAAINNGIALGNTSASAVLTVNSNDSGGSFGAYPSDSSSARRADRVVLNTLSNASGIVLDAWSSGQDIRFFSGSATESARFDSAGNLGIGTTTVSGALDVRKPITASSGSAVGSQFVQSLTAAANNDRLVSMKIEPGYTPGSFTGVEKRGLEIVSQDEARFELTAKVNGSKYGFAENIFSIHNASAASPYASLFFFGGQGTYSDGGVVSNYDYYIWDGPASRYSFVAQGGSGNIGIGTNVPGSKLDLDGAVTIRETTAPALSPSDQGRIYFDSATDKFKVSEGGGAYVDLLGSGSSTLQQSYGADADGSDAIVALTAADDSLIFRNPASSGSDSTFLATFEQLNTGAVDNTIITHAGTGYALRVNDDGTSTDSTPFVINQSGNVGIGVASPGAALDVNGVAAADSFQAGNVSTGAGVYDASKVLFWGNEPRGWGYNDTDNTTYYTDSANATFFLLNGGNVGVGSSAASAKLDVNPATFTPAVAANARIANFAGAITEAGSGTHARLMGVEITPPTITGAAATVADTASLYVSDAPTATVSGANYGLWVDAGNTRLDGPVSVGAGFAVPDTPFYVNGTATPAANADGIGTMLWGTINEASSGNHSLMAGVVVGAPSITNAAATVTNTAALYIAGASSGTVSGGNYALMVNSGNSYFAGNVGLGSTVPAEKLDVNGAVKLAQVSAPGVTTDKLYNVSGSLYWNGSNISSAASPTLQNVYTNDASGDADITLTDAKDISITLADTATDPNFEITTAGSGAFIFNDDGTFTDASPFIIDTNGEVGVGTTDPSASLHVYKSSNEAAGVTITNTSNTDQASASLTVNSATATGFFGATPANFEGPGSAFTHVADRVSITANTDASGLDLSAIGTGSDLRFTTNGPTPSDEKMRITSAGNVGIGTTAPVYVLDVSPSGGTAATTGFFQDRTATTGKTKVVIRAGAGDTNTDSNFSVQTNASSPIFSVDGAGDLVRANRFRGFGGADTELMGDFAPGSVGTSVYLGNAGNRSLTSGSSEGTRMSTNFNPASGTATHSEAVVMPTINQTGGANGITRGLYVNPTLTAAADFRAIETVAGNVVFGSTSGNVGIGSVTPAEKLDVAGPMKIAQASAPGTTTDKLYNVSGSLYWNGTNISSGSSPTMQTTYGNDADGSDSIVALTTADDSLIFRNPASSGTDSAYLALFDQLATGAKDGVMINQAGTGYALRVNDDGTSTDSTPFVVAADGKVGIGTTDATVTALTVQDTQRIVGSAPALYFVDSNTQIYKNGSTGALTMNGPYTGTAGTNIQMELTATSTLTSGALKELAMSANFAPTSGTATFTQQEMNPIINQTGGANGITRGLYVNPTLTAAADFRAIETTAGNVFFGTTSGNVSIGTTATNYQLNVADNLGASNGAYPVASFYRSTGAFSGLAIQYYANGTTDYAVGLTGINGADVYLGAGTSDKAITVQNSSGNIGIGSITPAEKLDVDGAVKLAQVSAPGTTTDKLYNVSGSLYWNGTNISSGSAPSLQTAYGNDADGSDSIVALTTADDSLIFRNPASSGTDSAYLALFDQLATGAKDGVMINQAGTGYALRVNDDGTSTDSTPFVIAADGNVGIGTTSTSNRLHVGGAVEIENGAFYSSTDKLIFATAGLPTSYYHSVVTTHSDAADGNNKMTFNVSNAASAAQSVLTLTGAGNVGIGTTAPGSQLHIAASATDAVIDVDGASDTDTVNPVLIMSRSRGTLASRTAVASGDDIWEIAGRGYAGGAWNWAAQILMEVDAAPGAADMPGRITFSTTPDGSTTLTPQMTIKNTGNVGIGTTDPGTNKLMVKGPFRAEGTSTVDSSLTYDGANAASMTLLAATGNSSSINLGVTGARDTQFVQGSHFSINNDKGGAAIETAMTIWNENGAKNTFTGIGPSATSPNSQLQVGGSISLPITTKTGAYTATGADHTILCDATSGGFTVTLPTAAGITGRTYMIKKIDSSSNAVTIDGATTETIDGVATKLVAQQHRAILIQSDGTNWVVI